MSDTAPLRVLVVDDEPLAREELCYLLDELGDVEIAGQAADGVEAVRLAEQLEPDLVFLDVQMPGVGGFEVARRLVLGPDPPEVVFVTAFDQYALDAFAVNAVDYLLKPVDPARLEQAVQRARKRVAAGRGAGRPTAELPALTTETLQQIVHMVAERQSRRERLAVKVGERLLLVSAEEVIYASLVDDTILVVTGQVTGTSNFRTLDELQAHLDPAVFWRVHRSHVVNINKIKEIVPWFSRNYILRMKDPKATEIPVSRSQTKRLRDYLNL
jgi:two-component system LytT family response regulator/two-component system response regulator LytT